MKRSNLKTIAALIATIGIAGLAITGCTNSGRNGTAQGSSSQSTQTNGQTGRYTCSMHPEVLQDKPGDCPKCGMKLVEKR